MNTKQQIFHNNFTFYLIPVALTLPFPHFSLNQFMVLPIIQTAVQTSDVMFQEQLLDSTMGSEVPHKWEQGACAHARQRSAQSARLKTLVDCGGTLTARHSALGAPVSVPCAIAVNVLRAATYYLHWSLYFYPSNSCKYCLFLCFK